jgi:hypothetical protein
MTDQTIKTEVITEDEFDQRYDHVPSAVDKGSFYMQADETAAFPTDRIWTAIDGEDGAVWLVPGFHRVNAFAYVASVRPWESEDIEVRLDGNDDLD